MKKISLIILATLISSLLLAQKKGYQTQYYPNGNIKYEGFFVKKNPVGELKRYSEDGKLKSIQNFKGEISSIVLFNNNGDTLSTGFYNGHAKNGKWVYYSSQKTIYKIENYKNGELHGPSYTFDLKGDTVEIKHWANGMKNGVERQFFPKNQLMASITYKNDKLNGKFTSYNDDGLLEIEGNYKENLKDGLWRFYNPEGRVVLEITYVEGEPTNKEELEALLQKSVELNEMQQGQFKDPEDFKQDPMFYFQE